MWTSVWSISSAEKEFWKIKYFRD